MPKQKIVTKDTHCPKCGFTVQKGGSVYLCGTQYLCFNCASKYYKE